MQFDEGMRSSVVNALFDKAISCYNKKDFKESIAILERLLEQHKEEVEVWNGNYWLGRAYYGLKDYPSAIRLLERAFVDAREQEPDACMFDMCYMLGHAYWRGDDYERAIKYYELAEDHLGFYRDGKWAINRYLFRLGKGRAYVYLRRYAKAIYEFEAAMDELELFTDDVTSDRALIKFELARAKYYSDDVAAAKTILEAIQIPELPQDHLSQYHYIFARALYDLKNYAGAWEHASAIDLQDEEQSFWSNIYSLMGQICYWLRDDERAREYLKLSLEYEASETWVHEKSKEFLAALEEESKE